MLSEFSKRQTIAIVGAGNLGIALAQSFASAGYCVYLATRNLKKTSEKLKTEQIDLPKLVSPINAAKLADVCILTVPDDAIKKVCESLSSCFKKNCVVAHCSGALDSNTLTAAKAHGCSVCSIHPLNTFPSLEASLKLLDSDTHNTALYCEGDKIALDAINPLFVNTGFRIVEIDKISKPLYHAACVFACNYLTVLMEISLQTAEAAKLDRDIYWQALQPLIQSTLQNISEHGTVNALSGPIVRGDTQTIKNHLAELNNISKELKHIYSNLGRHAVGIVTNKGDLDEAELINMTALLNSDKK